MDTVMAASARGRVLNRFRKSGYLRGATLACATAVVCFAWLSLAAAPIKRITESEDVRWAERAMQATAYLESDDDRERELTSLAIEPFLGPLAADLLPLVEKESDHYDEEYDPRVLAALMLGIQGEREAVPALIRFIEWRKPDPVLADATIKEYPCAEALSLIGAEAIGDIFRHLRVRREADVSNLAVELFARIIVKVYRLGKEGPGAAVWAADRAMFRTSIGSEANFDRLDAKISQLIIAPNRAEMK